MSGLLSILTQSGTSLQTAQAWSSTVANNLANANTPGYARQRADITAMLPAERYGNAYIGRGSMLAGINQLRDRFVEAQVPNAISRHASSTMQTNVLQSISSFDVGNGVAPALSDFYAKLRSLAQDAGSQNYREAAVGAAKNLAQAFNSTATELQSARTAVDKQLEGSLPEINQTASQIAVFNTKIREAQAGGAQPNDLLDARQKLADRLSELTGATPVATGTGDLNLVLSDGTALVTGARSSTLSVQADATNRGHDALFISQPDGSGPVALNAQLGGQVGGMLAARDGALKNAETSIDQLAYDVSGTINAVHQNGYALDGTTGRALFVTSATAQGAALSFGVNSVISANVSLLGAAGSAASTPGDATNLQLIINTESTPLSGGTDAASTLAGITSQYGNATSNAMANVSSDGAVLSQVIAMRQSTSGVSIDEEMIDMQKAQRAYEAIAKVIQTTNTMLDTLMALK